MSGFPEDLFAGRRYAVLGLGRNGLPAAQALAAMGADVIAWDDGEAARAAAVAAGIEPRDPASEIGRCTALVLSPGIPHRAPAPHPLAAAAIAAGVPVLSDAELLFEAVRAAGSGAQFVGITGTNGKSTTTALLAHILAGAGITAAAGANLGTAALALPLLPQDAVYVLEMSSYMLERIATLRFDAAAMLNLSPDHLDRHGNMDGYADAKRAIFDRQREGDLAVIGIDDEPSRRIASWLKTRPAQLVTVSGSTVADCWCGKGVLLDGSGPILPMDRAPALPGPHNAQNAAAAAAIARFLGVPRVAIGEGIASFPGLPHRQQRVRRIGSTLFVNDSKATNADSTARALACFEKIIWIAGGVAKAEGIAPLAPWFPRIVEALLIGRDAPAFAATLGTAGVPHRIVETLERAVPEAAIRARETGAEVVLLSPACASFDQFSGFEARGDRFAALVQALAGGNGAGSAGRAA